MPDFVHLPPFQFEDEEQKICRFESKVRCRTPVEAPSATDDSWNLEDAELLRLQQAFLPQSWSSNGSGSGPAIQHHELVKSLSTCGCGFKFPVKYSTSQTNPGRAYFKCRDFSNGCRFFWWKERELLSGDSQWDAVYKEELHEIIHTFWVKNLAFFGYGFVCGILFAVIVMVLLRM